MREWWTMMGDDVGLRLGDLSIVHHHRRRYRQPKDRKMGENAIMAVTL